MLLACAFAAHGETPARRLQALYRVVHPRRGLIRRHRRRGASAEHQPGLGNTGIVFAALKSGSIDLYPEYTGTIAKEILKLDGSPGIDELNRALAPMGFGVAVPLGFSNSYALAMVRRTRAERSAIRTLSDLAQACRT